MRTGIFAYLASKIVKDSKEPYSFGKEVLEAVKNSKGTTEEELAGEMKGVLDSMSELKDCEAKDTLLNVVKDCFDNKEKAVANEGELTKTLDAMWVEIRGDSLGEIAKAFSKLEKKPEASVADTETKNKDSKEEKEEKEDKNEDSKDEEDKNEDSKDEKEDKEDKNEDSKDEEKDGCNKDSAPEVVTKDDILSVIKDALPELVQSAVKDVLGIKDGTAKIESGVVDSAITGTEVSQRDYSSFLDN